MEDFKTEIQFNNLNNSKKTISQATETNSLESISKVSAEKGNSGQECTGSNCLELNTLYKNNFQRSDGFSYTQWSEQESGQSGQSGCSGPFNTLKDANQLKGYGVDGIALKAEQFGLYLKYTVNNTAKQYTVHSTPNGVSSPSYKLSYTSSDPVSYTFDNSDLTIHFTEISYTFKCSGALCSPLSQEANGYACCYFTKSSDS